MLGVQSEYVSPYTTFLTSHYYILRAQRTRLVCWVMLWPPYHCIISYIEAMHNIMWYNHIIYIYASNLQIVLRGIRCTKYDLSVIWYLMSLWYLSWWHFLWISEQIFVMDDGWVHPMAKTLPSLSSTCNEILSWMMEIWVTNSLVIDSYCNIVIL